MEAVVSIKIGEKLSLLRAQKAVTQEMLADVLGISNKTISKWETGASIPESEYLSALADYFGVSIDEIFGRNTSINSIDETVIKEFDGLSSAESVKKAFTLANKIIRHSLWKISGNQQLEKVIPEHIVSEYEDVYRNVVSCNIVYEAFINSSYTNMALMIFQNECDFSWLDERADEISNLFKLLSDTAGIKLIKKMHMQGFPQRFTADYIAKCVGIECKKAEDLLELSVKSRVCSKSEAYLRDGKTNLYECFGDGMILGILNLAFEYVCGARSHECCNGGTAKMIRGDKK